jgi:hypothetical protein
MVIIYFDMAAVIFFGMYIYAYCCTAHPLAGHHPFRWNPSDGLKHVNRGQPTTERKLNQMGYTKNIKPSKLNQYHQNKFNTVR